MGFGIIYVFIWMQRGDSGREELNLSYSSGVTESAWKKLERKRIYFGHKSVGFDIIQSINDIMDENPYIRLNIIETSDPKDFNEPIVAHSRVGKNTDPKSKCDAFADFIVKGTRNKTYFAFFKFC